MIEPEMLRNARLMAGMSQRRLSMLSGVSQALISMIEAGKVRPSFEAMRRISAVLEKSGEPASKLMTRRVYVLSPDDSIRKAKMAMKRKSISQIPVVEQGKVVGTVRESDFMSMKPGARKVYEIMSHPLPQIDASTPVNVAKELLKFENAVIIMKNGRIEGILTKSDLI